MGDKKKDEIEKNKKFQNLWIGKNKEIEAIEKAEHDETRRMNMNLAAFHKQQARDEEKEREEQFIQDYQDAQTIKYSIMKEENDYMSYTERCVKEWDANGKSITPMILELQKQKKEGLKGWFTSINPK